MSAFGISKKYIERVILVFLGVMERLISSCNSKSDKAFILTIVKTRVFYLNPG